MIIYVAGTYGSGKTTLIKRVLDMCKVRVDISYKPPAWRGTIGIHGTRSIFAPMTWDSSEARHAACMIHHELGCDAIMEGGMIADLRSAAAAGIGVRLVWLDFPVQQCRDIVKERGDHAKLATVVQVKDRVKRSYDKLISDGTLHKDYCRRFEDRNVAQKEVWLWLNQ